MGSSVSEGEEDDKDSAGSGGGLEVRIAVGLLERARADEVWRVEVARLVLQAVLRAEMSEHRLVARAASDAVRCDLESGQSAVLHTDRAMPRTATARRSRPDESLGGPYSERSGGPSASCQRDQGELEPGREGG